MDLLPSAEELRDHLVNHDVAVRQIIILGELLYMVQKSIENILSVCLDAQQNCLIETVLLSIHNICLGQ